MKNIKNLIISIFAIIGLYAILIATSSSSNLNQDTNEVGTYQITGAGSYGGVLYRLNTKTGEILEIKQSTIDKINLNPKKRKGNKDW